MKYKKNIWEFPGGKIKKNENIICGLKRELLEEVGIKILKFQLFQVKKLFFKQIKLYFFIIKKWQGRPFSQEGYNYIWIDLKRLKFKKFPTANFIVIKKLKTLSKY
ncbi:NUDIX domain-containing protein [Buchnera aphidicola]|uniref:NUDIX domain-containing protein n=1 Tax=Buchnera aphidicola TaxID=9 RepID=UPI0021F7849A|nr:NUDIX domain-containing protein [Buchnera aphidicola]